MPTLFHGCRLLGLPALITLLTIIALQASQNSWSIWLDTISNLPYWLLSIAAALSIQFNRSRFTYLSMLLLLYFIIIKHQLLPTNTIYLYRDVWATAGAFIFTFFNLAKDRGIYSIHSLVRLTVIALCFGTAYIWMISIDWLHALLSNTFQTEVPFNPVLYLPIYIASVIIVARTAWQSSLANSATALTFAIWLLHYFQPQLLPLSVLLSLIAVLYICTILVDSYVLAYRDELTGLASRRALYNLVLSLGRTYSVAMLDIDHFKKFNDTYGHDVGDQVLKLVAAKLSKVTGNGKVFRYGGEEFTIVFPRKNCKETLTHLEDVRVAIEEYKIILRGDERKQSSKKTRGKTTQIKKSKQESVSVTISIGVATHQKGQHFDQCMKLADEALYRAKKAGRNQVCE